MSILYVLALTALSGTAVRAGNMVLVLYALKLGSSAFVIGLLGAMFAVLPMVFSMPAGKLADRYGSRAPLLICVAGSGLGLGIVRELVGKMGGTIGLESDAGQGSHFYFTVPFEVLPDVRLKDSQELLDLPVLVVDDNRTNQVILEETLAN